MDSRPHPTLQLLPGEKKKGGGWVPGGEPGLIFFLLNVSNQYDT